MRLLKTSHFELIDFPSNKIPKYAILSHTWGDDEVLFADVADGNPAGKLGYGKIQHSCREAVAGGFDYLWVDTCCIDKRSSAELSEAINSMYAWYKGATTCYVYLADVPANANIKVSDSVFAQSRWFKRGWTLQELIAPVDMVFFSKEWTEIGTKSTLCDELAGITGIEKGILTGTVDLQSVSLAKRMSWASMRDTTRIEDVAYCLMGLFDVNMPLLYGEGEKSFKRLQEEIIKNSDDQSLFAWTSQTTSADGHYGLLARSPADFLKSGNIMPYREWEPSAPFSISNKGLRIELHLMPYEQELYVAALDCPAPPDYEGFLGIYLKRVPTGNLQYVRVKPQVLCKIAARGNLETIYVRESVLNLGPQDIYPTHAFQLRRGPSKDDCYEFIKAVASSTETAPRPILTSQRWQPAKGPYVFKINKGDRRLAGALLLESIDEERFVILLGSTASLDVGFAILPMQAIEDMEQLQNLFHPQPPGTNMTLENHQVRVNVDPQIHAGVKYYMLDIVVELLYRIPQPIRMIQEIIPGLQSGDQQANVIENSSRGFGKLKLPWKSARTKDHSKAQGYGKIAD